MPEFVYDSDFDHCWRRFPRRSQELKDWGDASPCRRANCMIESTNNLSTASTVAGVISIGLESMNSFTPSHRLMKPIAIAAGGTAGVTPTRR
jgi:hypothetical protein